MTMKKKILTTLSVVLILGLAALGILAYLQSEDSDVNVMTLGNVKIEQIEHQRVDTSKAGILAEADIEDFEQGKPLLPYVDENLNNAMRDDYEKVTFPSGQTSNLFIGDNAIDKMIAVTNTGKSDAYVRTIIALEAPTDKIDLSFNSTDWTMDRAASSYSIEVDGVKYDLFVCIYKNILKPGETTPYSLMQFSLDWTATNEDAAQYGDTYDILALSQAVQTAGFENAKTALDTAFGEITTETAEAWFDGEEFDKPVLVSSAEEFVDVLENIKADAKTKIPGAEGNKQYRVKANIVLTEDIKFNDSALFMYTDGNGAPLHFYGFEGTLNLNGHKIEVSEDALRDGKDYANAVLLFQYSNVKIIGEGEIVANNKSIPVYAWANCTVDIYGGNYVTNASERNESAVYVNNSSATVNVYGGTYIGSEYAFNVHDNCGTTTTIVLHEGVTFKKFLKGTTDLTISDVNGGRIVYADGCKLEEYKDGGTTMYKVVKE